MSAFAAPDAHQREHAQQPSRFGVPDAPNESARPAPIPLKPGGWGWPARPTHPAHSPHSSSFAQARAGIRQLVRKMS